MNSPWVPHKPKSRGWYLAARIGDDVLIADGFCLVRLDAPSNPLEIKHIAKVIGEGPATTVMHAGAWAKDNPDKPAADTQNLLRQVWGDVEAATLQGVGRVPIICTTWSNSMYADGDTCQVRIFRAGAHVIGVNHVMLDLFTTPTCTIEQLTFSQRADAPYTGILVSVGRTPRGVIMPLRTPSDDLLRGLADLIGG